MRLFRPILPLFCLLLLFPLAAPISADGPNVSAKAYVLCDADTGEVFASRSADARMEIASTTKIMTALVVIERGGLDREIVCRKEYTMAEGSRMYLREGERLTLLDLLYGLLLCSGNDAALALACETAGSEAAFAELMNRKASAVGMSGTTFVNASGLPASGHRSTASDMAKLMREAVKNPLFMEITGTREAVRAGRTLCNHNRLLSENPYCDGGKTGYTESAGRCLVTTAVKHGRRLIVVTLSAPDDWRDHAALYSYGFSQYEAFIPDEAAPELCFADRLLSPQSLTYAAPELWLTQNERKGLAMAVFLPKFAYAPLAAGAEAGKIVWYVGGRAVGEAALTASAHRASASLRLRRRA